VLCVSALLVACGDGGGNPSLDAQPCSKDLPCPAGYVCGADALCHALDGAPLGDANGQDSGSAPPMDVHVQDALKTNADGELIPCIETSPIDLDFGVTKPNVPVTISVSFANCGPMPLELVALAVDAQDPVFSVDYSAIDAPGWAGKGSPSRQNTLAFPSGSVLHVPVRYLPKQPSLVGTLSGEPIPSTGFLVVRGKGTEPHSITLTGMCKN
jgi:hypothetical protein